MSQADTPIVFFTYNLNTATYSELATTWFSQIAFGSDGILYGTPSGLNAVGVFEINTDNATLTPVGPLSNNYTDITSGPGCPGVLTQGYWKNHAVCGKARYDTAWESLSGGNAPFLCTGQSYCEVLNTPPSGGNAYYILAHQYIAAELNQLNGQAIPPEVATAFSAASALLVANCSTKSITEEEAAEQAKYWAKILDKYNNGMFAPGHCAPIR